MEQSLWKYLEKSRKPVVLYGMGDGADKIIKVLESRGIEYRGVFATDGFVRDKYFHGLKLSSYSALKEKFGDMTVLLCFGSARPEVLENIKRISAEQELYAPDVPVYGGGLFTEDYYAEHEKDFEYVFSRLADEKSRETLECLINYKLSGKPEYLYRCEVSPLEPLGFLGLSEKENYLDLGAYNGDTVTEFAARFPDYESITAVEPDARNFRKLCAAAEKLRSIRTVNACVSDTDGTAAFSMRSGRNSSAGGADTIPSVTVDSLAENTGVSFIKMDIEGAECAAIAGAAKTLTLKKPKMQIACYHRTGDLTDIPMAVDRINPDYKIYLRHFPCLPAWDTNYFFIP